MLLTNKYPALAVTYVSDPCAEFHNPTKEKLAEMDAAVAKYEAEMKKKPAWNIKRRIAASTRAMAAAAAMGLTPRYHSSD